MFRPVVRLAHLVAVVAIAACVVIGPARPAGASWEPAATSLPNGFRAIVTDSTGRVFVSSPVANVVTVLDADGRVQASLPVSGAGAMLLHGGRLYVASEASGSIESFDVQSLTSLGPVVTGMDQPRSLAWAGGRIWGVTGYCQWQTNRLFSVDVETGVAAVHAAITGMSYCPELLASPNEPGMAFAHETGSSTTRIMRLDLAGGAPVVTASGWANLAYAQQASFSPAGDTVLMAGVGQQPYGLTEVSFATLAPLTQSYAMTNSPSAVAVDSVRGQIAGGGGTGADAVVFPLGWSHDFEGSGNPMLVARGLAWSHDGRTLYAVSRNDSNAYALRIVARVSFTSLSGSPTNESGNVVVRRGDSVTLTARVVSGRVGDTVDMGEVLFRAGTGEELGRAPVVDGEATLVTSALPIGQNGVMALYRGSRVAQASESGYLQVTVNKALTTVSTAVSSARSTVGQSVTLTASVQQLGAAPEALGGTVAFSDGVLDLGSAPVIDGRATLTVRFVVPGNHQVVASYSGDATYLPSTAPPAAHTVGVI